jgi:hypothetical protein
MIVDRMQGLHGASLPFFVSLFVFASVVCMFACVRVRSFVRLFVRTFVDRQNDRDRVGLGGGGVAKNHALVEAFYYRT